MDRNDQRSEKRTRVAVKVTLETAFDFYGGTTGDMSYGGVFVATEAPPPTGAEVTLAIDLPSGGRVTAVGIVRWVRPPDLANPDRPAGCGIAWQAADRRSAGAVRRFLSEQQAAPSTVAA